MRGKLAHLADFGEFWRILAKLAVGGFGNKHTPGGFELNPQQ